jgi:predicted nucleic acid-binding protein
VAQTVVVDISLALKWVLAESDTKAAEGLLAEWQAKGSRMIAPSLFLVEAANALHQYVRTGLFTPAEAEKAFKALWRMGLN